MSDDGEPALDAGQVALGDQESRRFGFIAVIGAPNAGKSTLVNRLVGAKVTIVSHKVQTTRMPVRGIAIEGASQLVFIDTPGIFDPKKRLERAMVDAAWGGAGDADLAALVVDAQKGITPEVERILERLSATNIPRILVLNKVDRVSDKARLLALAARMNEIVPFAETFMISAETGSGVEDLKTHLTANVPQGPWHYPEDEISDAPLRLLASEITREKIFASLHDELPYAITVETIDWKDLKSGAARIEQTIYVERDSQKSIVLGKGGRTIKQISQSARQELKGILERDVHLFIFVKVREAWKDDPERYREMGLEFPKE
ncbi:MAG: GTPase Era [Hyphomicrobiaceae bacterium]|nr:GTPase Era [Hyphomicrobiaceae bacterium]